jgi:phosphate uptake regulator
LDYRLAASLAEAIGDECVRVALKTVELKGAKMADDLKKPLFDFHTACFEAHENALNAFLTGDIGLAEDVRSMREKVEKMFANIEKIAKQQSLDTMPHILAVSSFLRQIYEHSVDIADLVMPKKT